MFTESSLRIYIMWIIPFINWPTSLSGALEIRVINFRESQKKCPERLPVDCSARLYLLAAPMSWQLLKTVLHLGFHVPVCFQPLLWTDLFFFFLIYLLVCVCLLATYLMNIWIDSNKILSNLSWDEHLKLINFWSYSDSRWL